MKTARLYTFGCKVNQYETQMLREYFRRSGYELTESGPADCAIINSCTVTASADRQCRQLVRKILRDAPGCRIIVTGCYAARSGRELSGLGAQVEVVTDKYTLLDGVPHAAITAFDGHSRAFVKVQDGCDAFCSYCIVPHVRPKLWSRPVPEIVNEVRLLIDQGYPEIVLTGIHLGRHADGLSAVLRAILAVPGDFRVRLSSIEALEITDELLELMKSEPRRICAHLHVPLQSAADDVLKRMNRRYNAAKFTSIIEKVSAALPAAGITTDVIVGFPGERDEDFAATHAVLSCGLFSRLHVFPYSPREGTPAASLPEQVHSSVIKERCRSLAALDTRLQEEFWKRFIGTVRPVVCEGGKGTLLTDNYIRLDPNSDQKKHSKMNGIFDVEIMSVSGKPVGRSLG